jgi:hypothetical protein
MRGLQKNKQNIYYSLLSGIREVYETDKHENIVMDEIDGEHYPHHGLYPGEHLYPAIGHIPRSIGERSVYEAPVPLSVNISAARGSADVAVFGTDLDYSKTICTTIMDLPITETSIVWYETEPVIRQDGTADEASADYSVVAIARSLTNVIYALRKRAEDAK